MARPLIGITGSSTDAPRVYARDSPVLSAERLNVFFAAYAHQIAEAGGLPVHVPLEADPALVLDRLDGLVIAGGNDVQPHHYGGSVGAEATSFDPPRDAFELALAYAALEAETPLLGTCRGHQILNVALGGTLVCHLSSQQGGVAHDARRSPSHLPTHRVRLRRGSALHRVLGDDVAVNSFHHQAIASLGERAVAVGHCVDGVIEAIEIPGLSCLGVQWHPEFLAAPDPLFTWLVREAQRRASRPLAST